MDEAGRAPEPPLIVAPPGLDMDPEVKVPDAVTENEVMSEDAITSNGASSHHNGGAADDSSRRVPFPADEIGKKKGPAHLVTESDAGSNGSAAEPKDSDGHSDGLVSTASGVLDSGRQAVKQAMAATTNWFSPSAKSDASDSDQAGTTGSSAPRHASPAVPGGSIMAPPPPSSGSGAPGPSVFSPGERRPTFTASSTATSSGTCIVWHRIVRGAVVSGFSGYGHVACVCRPARAVHVLPADGSRGCVVAVAGGASAFGAVARAGLIQCRGDRHPPGRTRHSAVHAGCRPARPRPGSGYAAAVRAWCKLAGWPGLLRRGRGVRGRRRCGRASEFGDVRLPGTQRRR